MPPTRALSVAAAASAMVLVSASPASATTVSASGFFEASLLGTATFGIASCGTSTLQGSVAGGGGSLNFASGIYSLCSGGVITPLFPWSGGNFTYSPGTADGTVTIANFRYQHQIGSLTCAYGGTITGDVYNGTNPNRPHPSPELQIAFDNVTVNRVSGSSFLCPGSWPVSFTYQLKGLTISTGLYDRTMTIGP